jgi:flagellar biogenesis protein FliO
VLNVKQDACRLYDKHLQLESSTADLPPRARFSSFDLLGQTLLCQQEDRLALVNVQDSQLVVAELAPIVHPPEATISTAICTSHEQLLAGYRMGLRAR